LFLSGLKTRKVLRSSITACPSLSISVSWEKSQSPLSLRSISGSIRLVASRDSLALTFLRLWISVFSWTLPITLSGNPGEVRWFMGSAFR
jgi:hypothetical protein